MEARAFGVGRRTTLVGGKRSAFLVAVAAAGVAAAIVAGVARANGLVDWYPYPVPTTPSVAPLALAPALLIVLAGMVLPPEALGEGDPGGETTAGMVGPA